MSVDLQILCGSQFQRGQDDTDKSHIQNESEARVSIQKYINDNLYIYNIFNILTKPYIAI